MKPRLLNLTARGFLKIEETALDLTKKTNILVGNNRAGKTSLASSLEWALTGKACGIRFKKHASGLLNDKTTRAEVVLSLENGVTVRRHRTKTEEGLRVILKDSESDTLPEEMIGWQYGVNPNAYFSAPEDKRTQLIFDLVYQDQELNAQVYTALSELEIPDEPGRRTAEEVVQHGFKETHALAVDGRRSAKRRLEEAHPVDPESAKIYGTMDLSEVTLAELTDLLKRYEDEKAQLLETKGSLSALPSRPAIERELTVARNALTAAMEKAKPNPEVLESNRKSTNRLKSELEKAKSEAHERRAKAVATRDRIIDVDFEECPYMPIKCPVSLDARMPLWQKHKESAAEAEKAVIELDRDIESLSAKLDEFERRLLDIRETLTDAERAREMLPELQKRVSQLETALESAPTESPDDLIGKIRELDTRLDNGRKLIAAKERYDALVVEATKSKAKIAALEQEVNLCDRLAKALAPDGIQKKLTETALGKFRERISESAAIFGDRLDLDDEFMPVMNGHHWLFMSASERWLASAIFQETIAHLSGCPWLVLDGVDILDSTRRGSFMAFLEEVAPSYSSVLAFVTVGDIAPQASNDPDIDMWIVEDGKAVKLAPEQEAA